MINRALALVFIILFSSASYAIGISEGEPAPGSTLTSLSGEKLTLNRDEGKVTVLIYWRTDNDRSILALKDANAALKELNAKEVRVIGIIADTDKEDLVKNIISENKIEFPVVVDHGRQFYSDYGIRVYPSTMIIDKKGILVHSIPGHPLTYRKLLIGHVKKALGEIDEAKFNELVSPHNEEADQTVLESQRLYNLAIKFMENGMTELAVNSAKKSIEAKPDMLQSQILLGFLYLETEDPDSAIVTFKKALELDPQSHNAKTGMGGALVMKGSLDKAIEILNEAAVANPYAQMTYYELGKAYELKGEKDKSIEMYKKAIEKIIHKQILPGSISKCK